MVWRRLAHATPAEGTGRSRPASQNVHQTTDEKADQPHEKPDQPREKADQPREKADQPRGKPDQPREKADQPRGKPDQPREKADQPRGKAGRAGEAGKRPPEIVEPSAEDVDRLVDEGMMIVHSALRMSAKNRMIVQALGSDDGFDEAALIHAARVDALALAEEKSEEAARLETVATRAAKRPGRANRHDDYRRQDVQALTLRERVNHETSRRLHDLSEDDATLRSLIAAARESALDDVLQARLTAAMPYRRDPDYRQERPERMRLLAADLAVLRRRQKARLGDRLR